MHETLKVSHRWATLKVKESYSWIADGEFMGPGHM